MSRFVVIGVVTGLLTLAACTTPNPAYQPTDGASQRDAPLRGTLGGPCYPNNTCNAGLVCAGGICVRGVWFRAREGATCWKSPTDAGQIRPRYTYGSNTNENC